MISRRRLLVGISGALLGAAKCGFGQERPPWRVGVIHSAFLPGIPSVQGLKAGLKADGIEEGRQVVFDIRPTRGGQESARDLAAALVASRVDLIYTNNVQPSSTPLPWPPRQELWSVSLAARSLSVAAGRIRYREDIVDGLENAPGAFIGMLEGRNFGKLIRMLG